MDKKNNRTIIGFLERLWEQKLCENLFKNRLKKSRVFGKGFGVPKAARATLSPPVQGPRGGPILKGGVNALGRQNQKPASPSVRLFASRPGQKGLGFQGLSGMAFPTFPGLPWRARPGLLEAKSGVRGPPLASIGIGWLALAFLGLLWPA